jgi:hypothetical protein
MIWQSGIAFLEALDYDFDLSKLERVMSGAGKVAALGHELARRGLKRTMCGDWEYFGQVGAA